MIDAQFLGSRRSDCTTNMEAHCHDYYELNFLTSGNTRMRIDRFDVEFNSFDFLLIPPGYKHLLYESKYAKFDNYVIWFKKDDENCPELDNVIKLHDNIGSVRFLCSEIYRLFSSTKMEEKDLINIYLQGVLDHMLKGKVLDVSKTKSHTDETVNRAVELINNNIFVKKYSVQELADEMGISTSYLTRIFNQKLGMAPLRYINEMKINRSKELMLGTSKTIKQISADLFFSDPMYFSRTFSEFEGVSPKLYRKLYSGIGNEE